MLEVFHHVDHEFDKIMLIISYLMNLWNLKIFGHAKNSPPKFNHVFFWKGWVSKSRNLSFSRKNWFSGEARVKLLVVVVFLDFCLGVLFGDMIPWTTSLPWRCVLGTKARQMKNLAVKLEICWWYFMKRPRKPSRWFLNMFYVHPYLGKIPILTNIFQMGWTHQLETFYNFTEMMEHVSDFLWTQGGFFSLQKLLAGALFFVAFFLGWKKSWRCVDEKSNGFFKPKLWDTIIWMFPKIVVPPNHPFE